MLFSALKYACAVALNRRWQSQTAP